LSSPDFRVEGRDKKEKKFSWAGLIEKVEVILGQIQKTNTISESVIVTETSS